MILSPIDNPFNLRPIGNIAKINQAQRRSSDDWLIKVLLLNILEITVEIVQVFGRRIP